MRCFIQDLSLNFHLFLDLFLHGGCSSSWQPLRAVSAAKLTQAIGSVQSDFLIPEQILLLDMFLIKLDNVRYIIY